LNCLCAHVAERQEKKELSALLQQEKSNDIALFVLQQRRQFPSFPAALRHAHTGSSTFEFFLMSP